MNYRTLFLHAVAILMGCFITAPAFAQAPSNGELVLNVRGLTSAMRDGLASDLQQEGRYRIAFACVPAGILIVEATDPTFRSNLRTDLMPVVHHRIEQSTVRTSTMSRNAAEAACAEARNQ
ncbi:MAG: hypothetical protein KDC00_02285 [Flavobacteriales bacterium]|nr:hypothetical protein [Flavobacteriales bacterium]